MNILEFGVDRVIVSPWTKVEKTSELMVVLGQASLPRDETSVDPATLVGLYFPSKEALKYFIRTLERCHDDIQA